MAVSNKMSWNLAATLIVSLAIGSSAAIAGPLALVDSFSDTSLSEYTKTLVLDQNATSDISFISPAGQLQVTKSAGTEAEQVLFLRDDFSLAVDEILRVDLNYTATAAMRGHWHRRGRHEDSTPLVYNAGLGGTQETRRDYAAVYVQADANNLKGLYVNGAVPGPTIFAGGFGTLTAGDVLGLYIRRDTLNDFALGYTTAAGDIDFATQSLDKHRHRHRHRHLWRRPQRDHLRRTRQPPRRKPRCNSRLHRDQLPHRPSQIDQPPGTQLGIRPIRNHERNRRPEHRLVGNRWRDRSRRWLGPVGRLRSIPLDGDLPAPGRNDRFPPWASCRSVRYTSQGAARTGFAMSMSLSNGGFLTGPVDFVTPTGLPGDYNGDNTVNAADYTVWRDHLGQTFQLTNENPADANPGVVNQADYAFWKSQFGMTLGSGAQSNTAVPEPASAMLLLVGSIIAALYRRSE